MNKMKSATCAWISFHNHFFLSDFFFLKEKGPSVWQGRQDSNSRHLVLETSALPTELRPYALSHYIIFHR